MLFMRKPIGFLKALLIFVVFVCGNAILVFSIENEINRIFPSVILLGLVFAIDRWL